MYDQAGMIKVELSRFKKVNFKNINNKNSEIQFERNKYLGTNSIICSRNRVLLKTL